MLSGRTNQLGAGLRQSSQALAPIMAVEIVLPGAGFENHHGRDKSTAINRIECMPPMEYHRKRSICCRHFWLLLIESDGMGKLIEADDLPYSFLGLGSGPTCRYHFFWWDWK